MGACGRVGCTHSPQPTPMVHSRHACTCTTPHMYLYLYSMDHVCALTSRRYLNAMQSPGASEKPTFSVVRRSKSLMARDRMSHACTDTGCHIRSYAWQDFTSGHMPGRMSHQVTCLHRHSGSSHESCGSSSSSSHKASGSSSSHESCGSSSSGHDSCSSSSSSHKSRGSSSSSSHESCTHAPGRMSHASAVAT